MKKKMVIITGCGRSGTLYMRKVFEVFGYDIGHEGLREDGITSWYIVDPHHWNITDGYIKKRKEACCRQRVYIHLVRNPLKVISSFRRCEALPNRAALDFFRRSMPRYNELDPISHIAKYWIEWNKAAEVLFRFDEVVRVEDMQYRYMICRLANIANINNPQEVEEVIRKVRAIGEKTHTILPRYDAWLKDIAPHTLVDVTFEDVYRANKDIAIELLREAECYGYNIKEGEVAHG